MQAESLRKTFERQSMKSNWLLRAFAVSAMLALVLVGRQARKRLERELFPGRCMTLRIERLPTLKC